MQTVGNIQFVKQVKLNLQVKVLYRNSNDIGYEDFHNLIMFQLYSIGFSVSQYMMYINSAANPFIYGLMHTNFRRAAKITFTCFFNEKVCNINTSVVVQDNTSVIHQIQFQSFVRRWVRYIFKHTVLHSQNYYYCNRVYSIYSLQML